MGTAINRGSWMAGDVNDREIILYFKCCTCSIIYNSQTILYERDELLVCGNFHETRRRCEIR